MYILRLFNPPKISIVKRCIFGMSKFITWCFMAYVPILIKHCFPVSLVRLEMVMSVLGCLPKTQHFGL